MLEVSKYIKDLLFVHDCVILPGFGGFVANYESAKIDHAQNMIFPPTKAIRFNRNLDKNDGLLIHRLSEEENMSYSEAEKTIQFFTEDIYVRIQRGEKVVLKSVGTFYNDKRNNLQFEPSYELNFLADTFGLEQVCLPVLSNMEDAKGKEIRLQDQVRTIFSKKKIWYAAAALPFVFGVLLFKMDSSISDYQNSASFNLIKSQQQFVENQILENAEISPDEDFVYYEPKIEADVVIPQVHQSKYFLIAGSFSSKKNAEVLRKELIAQSHPAIIIKNNKLFSVAVNQSHNKDEMTTYRKNIIAQNPKVGYWILKK